MFPLLPQLSIRRVVYSFALAVDWKNENKGIAQNRMERMVSKENFLREAKKIFFK